MKEFEYRFTPNMPEQCSVSFVSTGSKGGDSGYGGNASLILSENGSNMNIQADLNFTNGEKKTFEDLESISLTVCGDWELEGLAIALLDIGRKLLSKDDIVKDYAKWELQE
jgi:hypothetical protein